jgi:DNA-binding GntR family transcriptional regulator
LYFVNSKKSNAILAAVPTPLHLELADRIARLIHDEALKAGARLNENRLAEQLGVSRTPVRAALEHLAAQGFVERKPNRGVELIAAPPLPAPATESNEDDDELVVRISHDRQRGHLADYVSEKDLMACYDLGRPTVKQALERLAELGVVERKLGYGWRFLADVWDYAARQESYRFRMVIEPAAIREPSFALPDGWYDDMKAQHERFLRAPWAEGSSVAFFEMNAAFHEGVAAASGNRFFVAAIQRQNRLRRLANYDWKHGRERVEVNCREHLEMLAHMHAGDTEWAALLMQRHLHVASRLSATFANPPPNSD